jgi:hypothetical protein
MSKNEKPKYESGYDAEQPVSPQLNRTPRRIKSPSLGVSGDIQKVVENFNNADPKDRLKVLLDAAENAADNFIDDQIIEATSILDDIRAFGDRFKKSYSDRVDVVGKKSFKAPSNNKFKTRAIWVGGILGGLFVLARCSALVGDNVTGGGISLNLTETRNPSTFSWAAANFFDTNKANLQQRVREVDDYHFIDCQIGTINRETTRGFVEPYIQIMNLLVKGDKNPLLAALDRSNNLTPSQKVTVKKDLEERFDSLSQRMQAARTDEQRLLELGNFLNSNIDTSASPEEQQEQSFRAWRVIAAMRGNIAANKLESWWQKANPGPDGSYWAIPRDGEFGQECADPVRKGKVKRAEVSSDKTELIASTKLIASGKRTQRYEASAKNIYRTQNKSYSSTSRRRI